MQGYQNNQQFRTGQSAPTKLNHKDMKSDQIANSATEQVEIYDVYELSCTEIQVSLEKHTWTDIDTAHFMDWLCESRNGQDGQVFIHDKEEKQICHTVTGHTGTVQTYTDYLKSLPRHERDDLFIAYLKSLPFFWVDSESGGEKRTI